MQMEECKPPHEMSRFDYYCVELSKLQKNLGRENAYKARTYWKPEYANKAHEKIVRQALAEGKTVPKEVMNDYPELKTIGKREYSGGILQRVLNILR